MDLRAKGRSPVSIGFHLFFVCGDVITCEDCVLKQTPDRTLGRVCCRWSTWKLTRFTRRGGHAIFSYIHHHHHQQTNKFRLLTLSITLLGVVFQLTKERKEAGIVCVLTTEHRKKSWTNWPFCWHNKFACLIVHCSFGFCGLACVCLVFQYMAGRAAGLHSLVRSIHYVTLLFLPLAMVGHHQSMINCFNPTHTRGKGWRWRGNRIKVKWD